MAFKNGLAHWVSTLSQLSSIVSKWLELGFKVERLDHVLMLEKEKRQAYN